MSNLPARRHHLASVIPLPATAPPQLDTAVQATEALAKVLTDVIAPMLRGLAEAFPQPVLCPACQTDMARWTEVQRDLHWDGHGALIRLQARVRGLWR